jgi:hypothetical protein
MVVLGLGCAFLCWKIRGLVMFWGDYLRRLAERCGDMFGRRAEPVTGRGDHDTRRPASENDGFGGLEISLRGFGSHRRFLISFFGGMVGRGGRPELGFRFGVTGALFNKAELGFRFVGNHLNVKERVTLLNY